MFWFFKWIHLWTSLFKSYYKQCLVIWFIKIMTHRLRQNTVIEMDPVTYILNCYNKKWRSNHWSPWWLVSKWVAARNGIWVLWLQIQHIHFSRSIISKEPKLKWEKEAETTLFLKVNRMMSRLWSACCPNILPGCNHRI